jgi:peptide/nickel transport system permease protein
MDNQSDVKKRLNLRSLAGKTAKPIKILLVNNKSKAGFILLASLIIFGILGQFFAPYNPNRYEFAIGLPPSYAHLLGTTAYGQDVFSQLFYGAAPTLMVGFAVGILGTFISIAVGISAGFASERVNAFVTGIINIFLIIPGILLIMLLGSFFMGLHQSLGYLPTILILIITGWAFGARTLRSITLSIAKRDFILSSILVGESRISIIFRQIIRAIFPVVISNFFFTSMYGTMGLTFVEYLGVGNLMQVNWGTMLYWAINNEAYLTGMWWWILPPSFMISILMFSFILLNFGMDEIGNPSLRRFNSKKNKKNKKIGGDLNIDSED